jgi:RHS repeat-associated protein
VKLKNQLKFYVWKSDCLFNNQIVLLIGPSGGGVRYYVHDHLYSPVALTNAYMGTVILERYEYDSYGQPRIFRVGNDGQWFTSDDVVITASLYGNPYLFTGRQVDIFDSGSLKIQYNRNRYLDYYTGRWTTEDPLGIVPNAQLSNYFIPKNQYTAGLNLYEYVLNSPVIGIDSYGLETWPSLLSNEYKFGTGGPPDGDWEHGAWRSELLPLSKMPQLTKWQLLGFATAIGGKWSYPDAARYLLNYLDNGGQKLTIDYARLLKDSPISRYEYKKDLKNAMREAERLVGLAGKGNYYDSDSVNIVQRGHTRKQVTDSKNWAYAVQTFYTWGQGSVRKGKDKNSCCYYMKWTSNFRDNYEFKNQHLAGGLVYDDWMYELNKYGMAQHFKTTGIFTLDIVWIKGYDLQYEDNLLLIEGKQRAVPQCQ